MKCSRIHFGVMRILAIHRVRGSLVTGEPSGGGLQAVICDKSGVNLGTNAIGWCINSAGRRVEDVG